MSKKTAKVRLNRNGWSRSGSRRAPIWTVIGSLYPYATDRQIRSRRGVYWIGYQWTGVGPFATWEMAEACFKTMYQ